MDNQRRRSRLLTRMRFLLAGNSIIDQERERSCSNMFSLDFVMRVKSTRLRLSVASRLILRDEDE